MNVHDLDANQVKVFRRVQDEEWCDWAECADISDTNLNCHCFETLCRRLNLTTAQDGGRER